MCGLAMVAHDVGGLGAQPMHDPHPAVSDGVSRGVWFDFAAGEPAVAGLVHSITDAVVEGKPTGVKSLDEAAQQAKE